MKTLCFILLCLGTAWGQTASANQGTDNMIVVGNQAQPVDWQHRPSISAAIQKAGPQGVVLIPAGYTGTDCNPLSTCNPSTTVILDFRNGAFTTYPPLIAPSVNKTPSVQPGTAYPFVAGDASKLTVFTNPGTVNATIPAPSATGFGQGTIFSMINGAVGTVNLTCGCNLVVNGISSGTLTLTQGDFVNLYSDGASTYYGDGGSFALTSTSNSFAPGTVQTFTGDPNGVLPAFIIGLQSSVSVGGSAGSVIGLQSSLSANAPRMGWVDGQGTQALAFVTNGDTACDLLNQCTGDPTTPVVTQKSPQLITPNIDNATGISVSIPNQPNGNLFDLQKGTTTPYCQVTPTSGHIYLCYGSDGKLQGSFNGDALGDLLRTNDVQAKKAVAGCTTGTSVGNVCASAITVTWPTSFADTNYSVTCTPTGGAPTNLPSPPYVVSKSTASVTVNYYAVTAAAASWPAIDCEAKHD